MRRLASFLALTLSAAITIGCDSGSTGTSEPAKPSAAAPTAATTTKTGKAPKKPMSELRKPMGRPQMKTL